MRAPCLERCPWCGHPLQLVWVHGHGQCGRCHTNVEECCRGEQAAPVCEPLARPSGPSADMHAVVVDAGVHRGR